MATRYSTHLNARLLYFSPNRKYPIADGLEPDLQYQDEQPVQEQDSWNLPEGIDTFISRLHPLRDEPRITILYQQR